MFYLIPMEFIGSAIDYLPSSLTLYLDVRVFVFVCF